MAKEKITRQGARGLAAQRAAKSGKAFNAELAAINVEFDVSDTASSSYGHGGYIADSGSSYGSDSGSCGGGYSGSE